MIELAKGLLALAPTHAHGATVRFYEHQNVTYFSGGGMRCGPERLIETVHVVLDT